MRIPINEFLKTTDSTTDPLKISRGKLPNGDGTQTNQGSGKPFTGDQVADNINNMSGIDSYSLNGSILVSTRRQTDGAAPYNDQADTMPYTDFVEFLKTKDQLNELDRYYKTKTLEEAVNENILSKRHNIEDIYPKENDSKLEQLMIDYKLAFKNLNKLIDWINTLNNVDRFYIKKYINDKLQ